MASSSNGPTGTHPNEYYVLTFFSDHIFQGTWTAEACLEQPSFIQHEFFDNAISLISGKVQENEGRANVYHQYAKFAEAQYKAALDSPDLIRLNLYRERKEKELEHYEQKVAPGRTTDKRIINQIAAVKKVLGHDNKAMSDFIANRDASLKQAIQMYSLCLQASDTFDEDVPIRLCSLWLSNFDNNAVQKQLVEALDRVPSRKLVFLAVGRIFNRSFVPCSYYYIAPDILKDRRQGF